jgi:hypothetical protein
VVVAVCMASIASAQTPKLPVRGGTCGNGKVDKTSRTECAPCAESVTDCPCATVLDALEPCDGADLDGKTCETEGFFMGQLRCTASCTVDTGKCTRLPGDVPSLRHRAVGKSHARAANLGGQSNVVYVLAPDGKGKTVVTPYNFDLRGPWGSVVTVDGDVRHLNTAAIRAAPTSFEYGGVDTTFKSFHTFENATFVAATPSNFSGKLVAYNQNGASYVQAMDEKGKPSGKPLAIGGTVRALTYLMEGFVVAYTSQKGELEIRWFSKALQELGAGSLPIRGTSFALAAVEKQLVIAHADKSGAFVTLATIDKSIKAAKAQRVVSGNARIVGAMYDGHGIIGLVDNGKGTFTGFFVDKKSKKLTSKKVLTKTGAIAHDLASLYDRLFIAWTTADTLYLSSVLSALQ